MAWGLHYTHDRKKYLKNMYFWSIGMAVGDVLVSYLVRDARATPNNNIFTTLLLIGIIVTIIERFRQGQKKSAMKMLGLFLAVQVIGTLLFLAASAFLPKGYHLYLLPISLFPNLLFCEGGFLWVAFGVVLYFTKEKKVFFSAALLLFAVITPLFLGAEFTFQSLFFENYEWMMVGALPFMLCYNGKKGHGFKRLFYIFYPAHIFLLCWIGSFT